MLYTIEYTGVDTVDAIAQTIGDKVCLNPLKKWLVCLCYLGYKESNTYCSQTSD